MSYLESISIVIGIVGAFLLVGTLLFVILD